MLEANKFKLGLFVIFSIAVFTVCIASLGVFEQFKDKAHLMTLFTESVQGLNAGSAVKFKGVPVGKVTDIMVNAQRKRIRVDMNVDLAKFRKENTAGLVTGNSPALTEEEFYAYLNTEIGNGLRCQIEPDGITGMKYIEMDYPKNPGMEFIRKPGYDPDDAVFYLPASPSFLGDLRTAIMNIAGKLEQVDYKGISDKASATLVSADKVFNDPRLLGAISNIESASGGLNTALNTLNKSMTPERMENLMKDANGAIRSIRELSELTRKQLEDAELGNLSQSIRETLSIFVRSNQSFSETMMKFNEGLDALIELIQYLDSDPASLISGKSKPVIHAGPARKP